jgi:D-glycero-alpha-D-manno-heptose-7-phosphate kinase
MIISRTPFRISFFGGGTDYPAFFEANGGAALSTTINKYCYVICRRLPPFFDYNYRIRYTQREETNTIAEIQHPSVRECLKHINLDYGVEIQHNADLPAMSGLGSSSAFTVGLLNALYALKGEMVTKRQLALDAIDIEVNRIRENVGLQDQTAAAFGGFSKIEFGGPQQIMVSPVVIGAEKLAAFQGHFVLFFTGITRSASEIAAEQIRKTMEKTSDLINMKQMVEDALAVLKRPGDNFEDFGRLLDETWRVKRNLTNQVTTPFIDEVYDAAITAGATGGKLLGAGGGGFILFFVKPELQPQVREKLGKLLHVPIRFQNLGSQIVYYAPEQNY